MNLEKIKKLSKILKNMGFKKESEQINYMVKKVAFSNLIGPLALTYLMQIKGHDSKDPTGFKWVEIPEEDRAKLMKEIIEFQSQMMIESIYEPATALYYILQALAVGDYQGAAFNGVASAIPFLPKSVGDFILMKLLPRSWVPLDTLLRSAKKGKLTEKQVKEEINKRIGKLESAKQQKLLPEGEEALLLTDTSMIRNVDELAEAPFFLRERKGSPYRYDPSTKSAQCDLSKVDISDISQGEIMTREMLKDLKGGSKIKDPVRLSKADHDSLASKLEEIDSSGLYESYPYSNRFIEYDRVDDHVEYYKNLKYYASSEIKSAKAALIYEQRNIPILKEEIKNMKNMSPEASEIQRHMARLSNKQTQLRGANNRVNISNKKIKYYEQVSEVLDNSVDDAIAQASNSMKTQSFSAGTSGKTNYIDFTDVPDLYKVQLKNKTFKLKQYTGSNAKNLINSVDLKKVKLGNSWKIEGDIIYHSPQGLPIKLINMNEIKKIHEVSVINHFQAVGNPSNIVLTLDFL